MDSRAFKFSHWHVVAFIDFFISDDSFERPPCVVLVQHQIRRIDGSDGLGLREFLTGGGGRLVWMGWTVWMGSTSTRGSSRFTVRGVNLGTLGIEVLTGFCFLAPWRLGRLSRSTTLDIDLDFLFPTWTEVIGTTGSAAMSSSPLVTVFSLFSLIVVIPATRKTKENHLKKKEKRKREKSEVVWTILTSTSSFLVTKILSNR